jgi:uncharacterized protein YhhL (DUF1145 family)
MHAATELATATAWVVIVLGFLRIPFATRLGIELPLSILLTLVVHDSTVGCLLPSLLSRNLFTLKE